jgi:uncharacterized FAD-dependent dehydrogenase
MLRINEIKLSLDHIPEALTKAILAKLGIKAAELIEYRIFRQAVDARKKGAIHLVYSVDVALKNEQCFLERRKSKAIIPAPNIVYHNVTPGQEKLSGSPIVVGSGPAGLFAALLLARRGYRPIVLERGKPVSERCLDVERFWSTGELAFESNLHFGEGGAGTFSDGKLTTLIHDPRCRKVLDELIAAGAPADILYLSKPHLGSDRLPAIVQNIRQTIIALGGEVRFNCCVSGLKVKDNKIAAVDISGHGFMEAPAVILAPGNSARDTLAMLFEIGVKLQAKPFSIGVRIEHAQQWLDEAQYGSDAGHPRLGAADYKLVFHAPSGRSAYTFCMCPGGQVVATATEADGLVTNGMSFYAREGANANSALLVGIGPVDFGSDHPLAGIEFQRIWERKAFTLGGKNYFAPVQLVGDFLAGCGRPLGGLANRLPTTLGDIQPTYRPGWRLTSLADCLPGYVTETLRLALSFFEKQLPGFAQADAVLTGVETRSSSPVRILRNEFFESSIRGLFPAGEGAGYAGGIMSSAVDGIRAAEALIRKYACPLGCHGSTA